MPRIENRDVRSGESALGPRAWNRIGSTPGLEAPIGIDEGREDVGGQVIELDGMAVGLGVGALVIRQIDGGLALQAQTRVERLLLEVDLRQGEGLLGFTDLVRLLLRDGGSGRSPYWRSR